MRSHLIRLVLVLACLVAAPAALLAAPVDATSARDIGAAQLARLGRTDTQVVWRCDVNDGGRLLARVFAAKPMGYIVVAADTDLPPVIAYSLEADYPPDAPAENPLLRLLTADLASRVAALDRLDTATREARRREWADLRAGTAADRFQQWPPAGSTPTGGWLESNWTQNAPYNNLCPKDLAHGGTRSLAGCPAVAMGMILNYHETVQGTTLDVGDRYWHNYGGNAYWIPDAYLQYGFPNFSTLNGYLATLTSHWEAGTALTSTDKAALVFACGVAMTQVYSASGSGTFGVGQAYDGYQRFGFTESRLVFDTDPNLYADLAVEMQNAQLAHLAVVDPGWTMGHNVVVDGYNTDDYFHLNFGWGGPYNGWYRLPEEIPYGLTVIEGVVMDIAPASTPVAGDAPLAAAALTSRPNPFNPATVISFDAPAAGRARLAVYDLRGREIAVLLDGWVATGTRSVTWNPEGLASGVYLARLAYGGAVETTRLVLAK